jgi:hypothetical protein
MTKHNHRRRNSAITFIIVALVALMYLLAGPTSFHSIIPKTFIHNEKSDKHDFQDASFEGNGKWYGLCKKNSIHSVADFHKTISNDHVLKAHFTDFKWEYAKMGRLEKATWAYVYYRKGDTIFRKDKPIVLASGDEYITDGNVKVRTTCCNRYTAGPPVYETEDLDADPAAGEPPEFTPPREMPPEFTPPRGMPPTITETDLPPENWTEYNPPMWIPPSFTDGRKVIIVPCEPDDPNCCLPDDPKCCLPDDPNCVPPPPPPPPPPNNVPEPSTIFLLGIGVVYSLILCFIYKKASFR